MSLIIACAVILGVLSQAGGADGSDAAPQLGAAFPTSGAR